VYNYIPPCDTENMATSFVTKLAKSGSDTNGNQRRIIIIPIDKVKEVIKNYEGKQVKITIEDI